MVKLKDIFKLLTICQLVILKIPLVHLKIQSRIVGGTLSTIEEAPFLVRLLCYGRFICGGTLIAPRFVVTAAHCVKDEKVNSLTVVAGVTNSSETGVRSKVRMIIFLDEYSTSNIDVAVVELPFPVFGLHIRPIDLCDTNWSPGIDVQIYGWGKVNETDTNLAYDQMRTATVQVFKKETCSYMYRKHFISKAIFCAATPGIKDACMGDSGGPAIINGKLCGVISEGEGCAREMYPGIYTNVSEVSKFIVNAVKFSYFIIH